MFLLRLLINSLSLDVLLAFFSSFNIVLHAHIFLDFFMHVKCYVIFIFVCFFSLFIFAKKRNHFSKRVNSTISDTTTSSTITTTTTYLPAHLVTASGPHMSPRKSWSSIAYNNKNFPDGKLVYDQQQAAAAATATAGVTGGGGGSLVGGTTSSKLFNKGYTKFERSGQDVMARASQIVQ